VFGNFVLALLITRQPSAIAGGPSA